MPLSIPPIVLVKTWLQLTSNSHEKEARMHAKKMIANTFGSVDIAIEYIEQSSINQKRQPYLKT